MSLFSDSLKKWFYHNDSNAAKAGTRICLLDASGNPAGSDELLRSLSFAQCPDDYVDMGLPSGTLWAKKNLGAVSETDYGMYVSWGNLEMHAEGEGYNFNQDTYNNTPAVAISADLTLEQDIAHEILGGDWRMPTYGELSELFDSQYTTNAWVTDYQGITGLNGRLVTSKAPHGNTLFFPAAGLYENSNLNGKGSYGNYWLSSFSSSSSAKRLYFALNQLNPNAVGTRIYGYPIRPVL